MYRENINNRESPSNVILPRLKKTFNVTLNFNYIETYLYNKLNNVLHNESCLQGVTIACVSSGSLVIYILSDFVLNSSGNKVNLLQSLPQGGALYSARDVFSGTKITVKVLNKTNVSKKEQKEKNRKRVKVMKTEEKNNNKKEREKKKEGRTEN